jgi:hypothetical protein
MGAHLAAAAEAVAAAVASLGSLTRCSGCSMRLLDVFEGCHEWIAWRMLMLGL